MIKIDKDFDTCGFDMTTVTEVVERADSIFGTTIECDGVIIAKIDKADKQEYEERFGCAAKDAALAILSELAPNRSLAEALEVATQLSETGDGPAYIGWQLTKRLYQSK